MERKDKNPKDYRQSDLLMRKTQPMMKILFHKNSQLPFQLMNNEKRVKCLNLKRFEKMAFMNVIIALLLWLPFIANAALTLPAIPSNSSLAKKFELSTEMVFRVKVGETYLPSGALIAYINGEIRGAQTASVNFPPTGVNVYKILIFNDKSGDEISFKYYDIFSEKIYDINEKIEFVPNLVPNYGNPQILNAFCKPIEQVTGLLPENGKENMNSTLDLYWQPSPNTTFYKLYIWKDGTPMPTTATYSNIYNTTARVYGLEYGQLYRWKVGSVNDCSQVESSVQTLRIRQLPDLAVNQIIAPLNIESGTVFNLSYTVKNTGIGNTAGSQWHDAVFASNDAELSNDDRLLSNTLNLRQLEPDSSYTKNLTVSLPVDFSGNCFFIVKTDYYNSVYELLETNNEVKTNESSSVTLKSLPDILVKDIQSGTVNINPGDSLTVSWKVENIGGTTAEGGWAERISIVPVSGLKITISPNTEYKELLAAGSAVNRTCKIKIPDIPKFSGQATIEVELIPFPLLVEYAANKANNKAESASKIILAETLNLTLQTNSVIENTLSPVRCIVSRSGNFSAGLIVTLSVSVAGQVTIPASVTIPAGQSSVTFDLYTINNSTLEGQRTVNITASASTFAGSVKNLTILDDEKPTLTGYFSKNTPTEGETIDLVIKRDLVTDQPLNVSIATNKPNQWTFTSPSVIPASKDSVKVSVLITDDNIPELNTEAILYISSAGVNSNQVAATIIDNDIPQVSFEILSDTVSESAGVYATWGVITRLKGDDNITVNLTQSSAGALFFPPTITLAKGVGSQRFNIGVVDNGDVDGFRKISISGSIYVSSCNCGTTSENGGIVKDDLVIADNDGPSLSISVFPLSLPEGKNNAGMLTISRNTPPTGVLNVVISHNDATEVVIQTTAVIPDGEKSVQIPIHTINDNIEDGNQMVLIQASSPTFSTGYGYVFVTDLNKPDLEITDLVLNSDTLATNELIEITGSAINNGFSTAPSGVKIKFYSSKDKTIDSNDKLLGEFSFPAPILQGAAADFIATFEVPDETGKFFILAKINPEQTITELAYFNNESEPADLVVTPEYNALVQAANVLYLPNTTINLTGSAFRNDNQKIADTDVDVYILSNGTRRELKVKTDNSGDFTVDFVPLSNESGHYVIGACFPGQKLSKEQDNFDIPGLVRTSTSHIIWDVKSGQVLTGKIAVKNTSAAILSKVKIVADKLPIGCELVFDTIQTLAGYETKEFTFILTPNELTTGKDYEKIDFTVSSGEGAELKFPAYYYCQALQANLKMNPEILNTTMTKDKTRILELNLFNNGAGESGTVTISLPNVEWMTLLSPSTFTNIASQDTVKLVLRLSPTDDTPLNTPISGSIAINCVNGNGTQLPYRIEAVSEETGSLMVDVIDEFTYYTEEKPHVKNAHVVVRHPFSGKIVAEGFTGDDGIFFVGNLPEGAYQMTVEAEKHEGFRTTITIDPGRVNEQTVFLSFQAITYTWEVVPTEIEDKYEVKLVMKFETNVPVPVVIIEMPSEMPQLFNDETFPFLITLTNKGLITAKDVQINLPMDDPEYIFLTNFSKLDLLAQQAIQVPVVMKRRDALKSATAETGLDGTQSSGPCRDVVRTVYGWECGKDGNWGETSHGFSYTARVCESVDSGGSGGWGGCYGCYSGPSRGGGGGFHYNPGNYTPSVSAPTVGCSNCAIDLLIALGGCLPTAGPAFNTLGCIKTLAGASPSLEFVVDLIICIGGYIPVAGCPIGLLGAAKSCFKELVLKNAYMLAAIQGNETIPPIIRQSLLDMTYFLDMHDALIGGMNEFIGNENWRDKNSFQDFILEINAVSEPNKIITPEQILAVKQKMAGSDVTGSDIDAFVARWNNTVEAYSKGIYSPTTEYPNIISNVILEEMVAKQDSAQAYALSKGFSNVGELFNDALNTLKKEIEDQRSSVCSSVTINISQSMVMTREAFEGTLTIYNGNKTTAMKEIKLKLEVKDENGILCNDLFQIETKALSILTGVDGTGTLGADQKGSATVLFIPTKAAAPTVPKNYSFGGSFSYLDPFTGVTVTKPLFPVTLAVNPSPDLYLHYFMQRDILGDDPLTEPIEPIVPAEFAVMIQNNGFGTAKNVRIEAAQPKIVENEKGLAINFALIGSNLNGQPRQLGLIDIDFGNIAPHKATIGQWWFTSTLLGHFISYEAKVTHLDSRGNPNLSLISGATMHELIRSVRVYSTDLDDNINDFLVNEVQDAKEFPDVIYLSNDSVMNVYPAVSQSTSGSFSSGIELLVTPEKIGWNYIKFHDPGDGKYKLVSVMREDGQVIPLDNVWQTHVTLPDGKEPVYENMMHFLDVFAGTKSQKYILQFTAKDQTPPEIVKFENVPTAFVTTPVTSINVVFNKPIDAATFNYNDMTLRVQSGADIMDSTVLVTEINPTTYKIDLTTKSIENGFYVLTVQTSQISSLTGTNGLTGKQATWTQFINIPAVSEFIGLPNNKVGAPFDLLLLRFNVPIDKTTLLPARLILKKDGTPVTGSITITEMDTQGKLFQISGLQAFMSADGKYSLTVDLPNIKSLEGNNGIIVQSVEWAIDQTAPVVSQIIPSTDGGYDSQHRTAFTVKFNEPVNGVVVNSLELWKDGQRQPISQLNLTKKSDSEYLFTQFRMLTYYEGSYQLKVKMKDITDIAGNSRMDTVKFDWVVYRIAPKAVTEMRITPDMGFSDTDAITATKNLVVKMTVNQANTRIQIYQTDQVNPILLADTANVNSGLLSLPVTFTYTGNVTLEAHCIDIFTNKTITKLPVFIDETALTGTWKNVPLTAVTTQPVSVQIEFSDKLLDDTKLTDYLKFERDGQTLGTQNLSITKSTDKLYIVSGVNLVGNASGIYSLTLDLSKLEKYTSGKKGVSSTKTQWTVQSVNKSPNANAGINQTVNENTLVTLNGSGSSDPDGDPITFLWTAPIGITLSSTTVVNPTFTAPEVSSDQTFTFSLTVNDGKVNSSVSQVKVTVRNISGVQTQTISLIAGWNIFSVNVIPDNPDLKSLLQPWIDDGSLAKVQDESGNSMEDLGLLGGWINNIGNLTISKGYKVKVKKNCQLVITGSFTSYPLKIPVKAGWNIIGFPHSQEINAMSVVEQLINRGTLTKVQDEMGNSIEDWGLLGGWTNNIGNFMPGKGYKIKTKANDTLTIFETYTKSSIATPVVNRPVAYFTPVFGGNGVDHMNINIVELPLNFMHAGDEIAVFDGKMCVGAVSLQSHHFVSNSVSIPVSAADNLGLPGFTEGNTFTVKYLDTGTGKEYTIMPEIIKGTSTFIKHETSLISLKNYTVTGFKDNSRIFDETGVKCYPNPFGNEITIEVFIPEVSGLTIDIIAQDGRQVKQLTKQMRVSEGTHIFKWDGTNYHDKTVSSGIYHLKIRTENKESNHKIIYSK